MRRYAASVNADNRVTIPPDVRRRLDLAPGDEVEFVRREGGGWELRKVGPAVQDPVKITFEPTDASSGQ